MAEEWRRTRHFRNKKRDLRGRILDILGRKCKCCGETLETMLEIDHVFGDGAEHRREIARKGGKKSISALYESILWCIEHNYRDRKFQVLCCNCNRSKYLNGGRCEHEGVREAGMTEEEYRERLFTAKTRLKAPMEPPDGVELVDPDNLVTFTVKGKPIL